MSRLPFGWAETPLGELRSVTTGSIDPKKYPNEIFELYSIPGFDAGCPETVVGREIGSTKKKLDPESVVISRLNPHLQRIWIVSPGIEHPKIGSGEWLVFPRYVELEPRYIAWALRQESLRRYMLANVSGIGGSLTRVRTEAFDRYKIRIAPLPEQQRIADVIDSYFSRLDAAQASLERAQQKLKAYRASVLKAAVEGRLVPTEAQLAKEEGRGYEPASDLLKRILAERREQWEASELEKFKAKGQTPKDDKWKVKYKEPVGPDTSNLPALPEGWCWATVDQVFSLITSGSRGWAKYYSSTGETFIRAQDISKDRLEINNPTFVRLPANAEGSRTRVYSSDILITITGANVTKAALVPILTETAYVNQHIALCRPVLTEMAEFLYLCIVNPATSRKHLLELAYGAGKPGLGLDQIKRLNIALPPQLEQERIWNACESHLSRSAAIMTANDHIGRRTKQTMQAILKWAFEGKLVDQDPNDEPAEELLKRIRAAREEARISAGAKKGKAS